MKNNIVLITENERLAHKIKSKIILLRDCDKVDVIEEENCFEYIKKTKPAIIYYHLTKFNEDEFFTFLQKAKQTEEISSSSIIMLYDSFNEDILCAAFESGISDFIHTKASETEFTIRTIWCLRKQECLKISDKKTDLLSEINIMDEKFGIYTENYTKSIIKDSCENQNGCLVLLAPDVNVRNKISLGEIAKTIKKTIRSNDIIGYIADFKILIWLEHTNKKTALKILDKIQKNLTIEYTISAGIIEKTDVVFEKSFELITKALSKALLKGKSFIIAEEKQKNINKINDKDIKKINIESILSPLFFQYQKINEEKFFETKLFQEVNNKNCIFKLENQNGHSSFVLSNKNNTDINIEILHNIKNLEIKADKISFQINDFDKDYIEELLNNFIKEFQKYTNY